MWISCKKEQLLLQSDNKFRQYSWSPKEEEFFALQSWNEKDVQSRNHSNIAYSPLLIDAYNQIADENEEHSFVDSLVARVGLPVWAKAFGYTNSTTESDLVFIPFSIRGQNEVSAIISLYRQRNQFENKFVINGMSRRDVIDTTSGNCWQKGEFARWMLRYDKYLFNHSDIKLNEAYCTHKTKIINDPGYIGGGNGPGGPVNPPNLCHWEVINICVDDTNYNSWILGTIVLPPHLDHDQDGLPNIQDPDWATFSTQNNLTQEQFEQRIEYWWGANFEDDLGDYNDYWEEYMDGGGQDWEDFVEQLEEIADSLADFFEYDPDPQDDLYEDPDDIECPDWPFTGSDVIDRDIRCEYYYCLVCTDDNQIWYSDIIESYWAPNWDSYQGTEQERLYQHWAAHYQGTLDNWEDLYHIMLEQECSCDFFSPYYENCVDECFVQSYVAAPPSTSAIPVGNIKEEIAQCFYSKLECPNCTYTATLHIEQPVPGTREVYGGQGGKKNGGHTFIEISQYDPSFSPFIPVFTKTFGWYPAIKPEGNEEVPGFFYSEDGNTVANISVVYDISYDQLEILKNTWGNLNIFYAVEYNNCSTAIVVALEAAGIQIPKTPRYVFPLGNIEINPADLGEDLRASHPGGTFQSSNDYYTPNLSNCR